MVLPPLFEFFDRWDNIPATGNDTAVTLVVIGLCVGLCFAAVSLIARLAGVIFFSLVALLSGAPAARPSLRAHTLGYQLLLFSPPQSPAPLRI